MARLHEYEGKRLLKAQGIEVPKGHIVRAADQAEQVAAELGGPVVLKVQAWITGRRDKGGVRFADTPVEAKAHAEDLLGMKFGNFPVEEVLVEQCLDITHELFVSLTIDDAARAPMLLLDCAGGTGIEARADLVARLAVSVSDGVDRDEVAAVLAASDIPTLGLFGPSREEHYAPWGPRCGLVRTTVPFEKIFPPDFDHRSTDSLMDTLSVDAAEAAARDLWQETRATVP
jgi:hypothetical protein